VFWLFPDNKKGERRLQPACLSEWVQATFFPVENDEEFEDWMFRKFVYNENFN